MLTGTRLLVYELQFKIVRVSTELILFTGTLLPVIIASFKVIARDELVLLGDLLSVHSALLPVFDTVRYTIF